MQPVEIHIHLSGLGDAAGQEVHVYVHGADGDVAPSANNGTAAPVTVLSREIQAMLARFENHDPDSAARRMFEGLTAAGWEPRLPQGRGGKGRSSASYIRMIYKGSKAKVATYINTVALICDGKNAREAAQAIPGAETHSAGVYFYFNKNRLEQALAAVEALRRWADGVNE
jgi:hypothetical protein